MGQSLVSCVQSAIANQGFLRAGERVGVAVSGGADSVALLLLLAELRKELGVVLSVLHFNHKLRGKHSDGDEKFVARLAAKLGLTFHAGRADVAREAKRKKANLEDAARRARYAFFAGLVTDGQVDKVAVAHTADDQAETVLAHILRGTGLAGLGGIHPRVGHVVRPLLGVRRADLRAYLTAKRQTWREDVSNRDTTRLRARIRKKLMPMLERQFQPAVVEHLGTLAELARDDEAFLDGLVRARVKACVERDGNEFGISACELVGKKDFATEGMECTEKNGRETNAFAGRLVRQIVAQVKTRAGQLNAEHVHGVLALAARGENGKRLMLPGGVEVRREHDRLIFCGVDAEDAKRRRGTLQFEQLIDLKGRESVVRVQELSCVLRFRVIDWPAKRRDTIDRGMVLDFDALQPRLVVRNWRPGDRLRPYGHRGAHKLKRLLSEKRVSGREREGWPVVTSGGLLVWARGFPVAAEFAAGTRTQTGLVISEEANS